MTLFSLVCMTMGYRKIRRKQLRAHRKYMLLAFGASSLFMVLFVTRFALYGATPFQGQGPLLWFYRIVFYVHEPLAVANVPVVTVALITGLRNSVRMHREIAPLAFRLWLFVSLTGVTIFSLLYLK